MIFGFLVRLKIEEIMILNNEMFCGILFKCGSFDFDVVFGFLKR